MNFEFLQRKISELEIENRDLHSEVAQVVKETDEVEEQERKLLNDFKEQLNSTNLQFDSLNLELERYKEENRLQNDQVIALSERLSDTEMRLHQLMTENDETASLLSVTKETQNMLALELAEYKLRYQETLAVLQETQLLLRDNKKRTQPMMRSSFVGSTLPYHTDSLQSELMVSSLFSESNSLDSGIHSDNGQPKPASAFKKVFDTVKCASKSGSFQSGDEMTESITQPRMSCTLYSSRSSDMTKSQDKMSSMSMYSSIYGNSFGAKSDESAMPSDASEDGFPTLGQYSSAPGCPGAKDLEKALKNLTSAEILSRRAMLSHAPAGTYSYDDPMQCQTPESMFSGLSHSSLSSTSTQWRLPKKLEIIKPIEVS